ncbi:glycosyl-4,4'-diaponeurosporenoate acyltransferase [Priestia koreensis]|uniref:glycosyl-4,4'-diaponeurosporenoate acyltransferase CrtO family protein n=1 Tax=Priestia koreensis TaxID=284581 RepID=UPI003D024D4D
MIEFSPIWSIIVNAGTWLFVHLGISYGCAKLPIRFFMRNGSVYKERGWEQSGRLYDKLRIKKWKDRLPEAGALFKGGKAKRSLGDMDRNLLLFLYETRRAEFAHLLCIPPSFLFFLWNPAFIGMMMVVYALIANVPFIMVQRYNRIRLHRIIGDSATSSEKQVTPLIRVDE